MKNIEKIFRIFMTAFLFTACFTACEDAVDKTNLGAVGDDVVWGDAKLIKAYFDNTMNVAIPKEERGLYNHSDEGHGTNLLYDNVAVNAADAGIAWDNVDRWPYETLRKINRFLDHAGYDGFSTLQPMTDKLANAEKEDMVGQMLVMRAFHYFDLVRTYGGVPLLLHEQALTSNFEDLQTPRAKTSECIQAIVANLDAAIAIPDLSFPMKRTDGHIGKGLAYALKGKVLLYYASPQFVASTGRTPVAARWDAAYTACKEAKTQLEAAGFGLYAKDGGSRETVMNNYYKMFITDELNSEMIWVRRHEPLINNFTLDLECCPQSASGKAYLNPTLEFVDAFTNADGSPYSGLSTDGMNTGTLGDFFGATDVGGLPGVPNNPAVNNYTFWENREPRFYAFIGYNGCEWPLIRKNQSKFSNDLTSESDETKRKMKHEWVFCWGTNTEVSPFSNGFSTTNDRGLGFYPRKFVADDRNYELSGTNALKECGTDWPLMRFAEVLLNFAETAAMTGKTQEAYDALDAIRKRAGIEPANSYGLGRKTGDALILDILNERKIELCFESQRFYDMRRWHLFTEDLATNKAINGTRRHTIRTFMHDKDDAGKVDAMVTQINTILDAGGIVTTAGIEKYFEVFYHTVMLYDGQNINYRPEKYDFMRIPFDTHIRKNPLIEQTQGWEDERGVGTFNPYQ